MRPSPLTARSTPLKTLSVGRSLASSAGPTWASAAGQGARPTNSASSFHRWRSRLRIGSMLDQPVIIIGGPPPIETPLRLRLRTDTEPRASASGRITSILSVSGRGISCASGGLAPNPNEVL
jgi:hypothetical protein